MDEFSSQELIYFSVAVLLSNLVLLCYPVTESSLEGVTG